MYVTRSRSLLVTLGIEGGNTSKEWRAWPWFGMLCVSPCVMEDTGMQLAHDFSREDERWNSNVVAHSHLCVPLDGNLSGTRHVNSRVTATAW